MARLTAVSLSRAFIRQTLTAWRLPEQIDSAELVVSELVTNALKSTCLADEPPTVDQVTGHHLIGLQLRTAGAGLYVEVWDRGEGSPVVPEQAPDAEAGRGLFLVEAVSERWGIHRPTVGGKVVWARLSLSEPVDPPLFTDERLLRDSGSHGPTAGAEWETVDTALMQRVLEGFRLSLCRESEMTAVS